MNRESFLETVKKHYADEIHEAYLECEHQDPKHGKVSVDHVRLDQILSKLAKTAKHEGLSEIEFHDLVKSVLPEQGQKICLLKKVA